MTRPLIALAPLATAALLASLALAHARAKELPRAFNDRPQHTGCEAFGPDFHKVEGSDTCIRLSGSVRAEVSVSSGGGGIFGRR